MTARARIRLTPDPSWSVTDATKLGAYLECPRKFLLRHRLGLAPAAGSRHLCFGIAVHEGLAVLYGAARAERPWTSELAEAAALAMEGSYRGFGFGPETDAGSGTKTPAAFAKALPAYMERWAEDVTEWETLGVEVGFTVKLPSGMALSGRLDAVQRRRSDGVVRALEHKTASNLGAPWIAQWGMSHQIGGYDYALRTLYPEENAAGRVEGVTVNAVECPRSGGLRFDRVPCVRSLEQAEAWLGTVVSAMERIATDDMLLTAETAPFTMETRTAYTQNPTACSHWGGCEFMELCRKWPRTADAVAASTGPDWPPRGFKVDWWDPLENTGNMGGSE